jgi:hypothetical protein
MTVITKRADGAIPYAEGMLMTGLFVKEDRLLMKSR